MRPPLGAATGSGLGSGFATTSGSGSGNGVVELGGVALGFLHRGLWLGKQGPLFPQAVGSTKIGLRARLGCHPNCSIRPRR